MNTIQKRFLLFLGGGLVVLTTGELITKGEELVCISLTTGVGGGGEVVGRSRWALRNTQQAFSNMSARTACALALVSNVLCTLETCWNACGTCF